MRLAASLLMLAVALPLQAEEKVLNLYNWADYVPVEALKRFQAETGIQVKYDTFDSSEVLESKLLTGNSGYDLVFPSSSVLARAITAKALQPLGALSNSGNLDPELLAKLAGVDPGNAYGVPYTWGTIGLGINQEAVEKRLPGVALDSLDLLFKPEYASKLKDCGIGVLDSPQEVIAVALNYLGKNPYSTAEADREAAKALLAQLQPNLRDVGQSRQIDDLAKGEICLALTYTGDAGMAAARALEAKQPFSVVYRIPKEGTLIWFDTLAIPVDAPHPEAARAFIDYLLKPEAIAELTNSLYFANANRAATPLLDAAVSGDPNIYPAADMRAKLFAEQTLPLREMRQRTRLWTAFRTQY
ncbi:spermidine/putrescine ABC transporter substrate-binding protein PotF [Pseudomonas alcaligenes]|uniref:Putrescine-binding periplasmic protein n=1 Tax=Aquipseudomonas alcaligenes TaxID=43263 RepID=A0ABR7S640_AQUAC|nr:polyamine ABC transporter substrate-binding protein [Pseudomonas alcaligenes]MBC9252487.1 spermidine/putrescine ABC transporter substrate-binding protein PotF [Pseudomonas alcaligenes]